MNPRDNPKEHKRMSSDYNEDEDETEDMTENTETDGGETELEGLNVHLFGEQQYVVGNPAEGTAYHVHLEDPDHDDAITCTCPDYRFRAEQNEHRACKHIQAVLAVGPSEYGIERMAYEHLSMEYRILSDKVQEMTQQLSTIAANATVENGMESRTNQMTGEQQSVPSSDAAGSGQQMASVSAEEAAEKLQAAYDESVSGMNVEAYNGRVWVNKSPDAPDFTFDAFLSGPSLMQYDPDGDSPGQYFKNYVEPGDVDEYISEVLG